MKHLTPKELERLLCERGWEKVRICGSHHHYKHPFYPEMATIPFHGNKPLKEGTQRSIMCVAGITRDEL